MSEMPEIPEIPEKSNDHINISSTELGNTGVITIHYNNESGQTNRAPLDVCCVVDTSGSMGGVVNNTEGGSDGFSRLDLVKHAVKTVVCALKEGDRFSLVSFASESKLVVPLIYLTDANRAKILLELEKLQPEDNTEIWKGIKTALDMFKPYETEFTRVRATMVLTDGEPSDHGQLYKLNSYGKLPCILNTYGFTYNLDSELLSNLAKIGNGYYGFIPDASFIGTTFVNAISNLAVITATELHFTLKGPIERIIGCDLTNSIKLGSLGDMPFNIVFETKPNSNEPTTIEFSYINIQTGNIQKIQCTSKSIDSISGQSSEEYDKLLEHNTVQGLRAKLIDIIAESMHNLQFLEHKIIITNIDSLAKEIGTSKYRKNPYLIGLLSDVSGQVKEALITEENYKKWGKHYLLALSCAHFNQVCTNFKDHGLKFYSSENWSKIRDEIDVIFSSLPAPKPSRPLQQAYSSSSYSSSSVNSTYSAPTTLASYNDPDGDCFTGESIITMKDGSKKPICEIKLGDKLYCCNSRIYSTVETYSTVECVIKIIKECSGTSKLVKVGKSMTKPWITSYHPICIDGIWQFPMDVNRPEIITGDSDGNLILYNLVLDKGHIVLINDIECVTLGHNIQDDVVRHQFFGTNKIIDDLKTFDGWSGGYITLTDDNRKVIRDINSNEVVKYERIY